MLSFLSQPINHPCSTSLLSSLSKPLQISVLLYIYEISVFGSLLSVKGAAGVSRPASFHPMPGLFRFIRYLVLFLRLPLTVFYAFLWYSSIPLCASGHSIPHSPSTNFYPLSYVFLLRFYSNPYNLFFFLAFTGFV